MLGHSEIRMTLANYTDATDEMQDAATAALENVFGQSTARDPGIAARVSIFMRVLQDFKK